MPRVVRFLRQEAPKAATLFLVGDIFDFWFEWRHSVPSAAFPVLAELHQLAREGRQIIYMAGNHDGHPGSFLAEQAGLTVSRGAVDAEVAGQWVHVVHGDGIAPADRGYRLLRSFVRWGPTETIYRLVHPDLGIWIAHWVSRLSYRTSSRRDRFGAEPYRQYARRKMDEGFNWVVMGHRHHADFLEIPGGGGYLAIGEWIADGTYGVLEGGKLRLKFYQE
jgi:UDP-2,3-diacylglucosamine hydrolase